MPHSKVYSRLSLNIDFGAAITIFGYQFSIGFDLTEWHLSFEHFDGVGYLLFIGPLSLEILDATKYKEEEDPAIARLKETVFESEKETAKYFVELQRERDAHEQDQVRLAGCGIAAQGYGDKPDPTSYSYSAAYEDVYKLNIKYKQALNEIDRLRKKLPGVKNVKPKSLSAGKSRGTSKSNRKTNGKTQNSSSHKGRRS